MSSRIALAARGHRSSGMRSPGPQGPSAVVGVAYGLVRPPGVIRDQLGRAGCSSRPFSIANRSIRSIEAEVSRERRTTANAGDAAHGHAVQRQRSNSPKHVGVHNHDPAPRHTWSQTGVARPACLAGGTRSADAGSLRVPIGNQSRRERGGRLQAVARGRRSHGLARDPHPSPTAPPLSRSPSNAPHAPHPRGEPHPGHLRPPVAIPNHPDERQFFRTPTSGRRENGPQKGHRHRARSPAG